MKDFLSCTKILPIIGVLPCDKGVLLQCTPFFSSEV